MYVVRDDSTGLYLNTRFGGRSERVFALARLEDAARSGLGDANRMCRAARAAHRGHAFSVLTEEAARALPRPVFHESNDFPAALCEADLAAFMYTLNGASWSKVGVIGTRLYVLKRGREPNRSAGMNAALVRRTVEAVETCRQAGLAVPAARLYEIGDDVACLSEYVLGAESLAQAWAKSDAAGRSRLRAQLQASVPVELQLGNEAVYQSDNIVVDVTGRAWLVDHGSALVQAPGNLKRLVQQATVPDGVFFDFVPDAVPLSPGAPAGLTTAEIAQITRAQKALFSAAKTINKHIEKKDFRPELQRMEDLDLARVVFEKMLPKAPTMAEYLTRLDEIDASRAGGWRTRIGDVPRFTVS